MIRWPWRRRRPPDPPRRVLRIVLDIDGRPHLDVSHTLALSMITCHFGEPIAHSVVLDDAHVVTLTLSEVDS